MQPEDINNESFSIGDINKWPKDSKSVSSNNEWLNKKPKSKKINFSPVLLGILVAILIGLGVWFVKFRNNGSSEVLNPISNSNNSQQVEATKITNPLTGEKYPEDAADWVDERPFGVMVNNHLDARPQSGLIYADIVYEVVAEGGITRFLAFFNTNTPEKIGPVRSIREYYLVLVKELGDAMIMHIGWSPQALTAIETWPVRSLARGGAQFWRDETLDVAIEHTAYVNGKDLRILGNDLGWGGQREVRPWLFKDDTNKYSASVSATEITLDFWYHGDYSGYFKYDAGSNKYLRSSGFDANDQPIPLYDRESKEQVKVDNLIVQFATESSITGDEKNRLEYNLEGSGEALIFIDGKVVNATWSKASRDDRTLFYDLNGKEMEFNRGKFWIAIVPDRNVDQVVYK